MSAVQRIVSRIPWAYTGRRLLIAIPTLLIIITAAFFMMRMAPGGPFDGERKLNAATEAALNAKFSANPNSTPRQRGTITFEFSLN